MTQLAQDILLIARSDQEGIPIRREPVEASAILDRIASRFEPRATQLGRAVSVVPSDDIVLDVDPTRVEQAIGILQSEIKTCLALLGCTRIDELRPSHLRAP